MSVNTITANVCFDYKGQTYNLSSEISVDNIIKHKDFYNSVYLAIAKAHDIGLYTYELEIMMDQDIGFSNAQGCADGCVVEGSLDLELLRDNHQKHLSQPVIDSLISRYSLDASDNNIVEALTEAYILGKK